MMVDVFCGILSGGPFAHHVRKWQADASVANLVGVILGVCPIQVTMVTSACITYNFVGTDVCGRGP